MNERDRYNLDFMDQIKEIRESPGFDILRRMRTFRASFSIYCENYLTLRIYLKQFYSNADIIYENSSRRWRKQRHIVKDYYNVISSAKSYVNHIGKENSLIVKEKIKQKFEQNSLYNFIRALRNFLFHEEPLSLISRKEFSRLENGDISSFQYESINKKSFENYLATRTENVNNSYDALAMQYLKRLSDKINLNDVMEEFNARICSFHKWFILNYVGIHKNELQNLYAEIKEIHQKAAGKELNKNHLMTQAQLRHLHYLLNKSDKLNKEETKIVEGNDNPTKVG